MARKENQRAVLRMQKSVDGRCLHPRNKSIMDYALSQSLWNLLLLPCRWEAWHYMMARWQKCPKLCQNSAINIFNH
jgi:hypothetical protein